VGKGSTRWVRGCCAEEMGGWGGATNATTTAEFGGYFKARLTEFEAEVEGSA
jgi:hypothetical protein